METQIRNPKLGPVSVSGFDSKFRFRVPISDLEFLISFDPDVLALRTSLVFTYWPFGPVLSLCTGPLGQFGPDWSKPVFYYMEMAKTGDVLFLEHQKTASQRIWRQIRIPRLSFTLKLVKTSFYYMEIPKTGDVLFLEHQKTASYWIWPQIRIPRLSLTLKTGFLLHGNAENRRCSIFRTSKNGVTPNLTSDSDSPSLIYPKTGQNQFFITWKWRKPAKFYFWNIKKQRHTKSDIGFGFPVLHLP